MPYRPVLARSRDGEGGPKIASRKCMRQSKPVALACDGSLDASTPSPERRLPLPWGRLPLPGSRRSTRRPPLSC